MKICVTSLKNFGYINVPDCKIVNIEVKNRSPCRLWLEARIKEPISDFAVDENSRAVSLEVGSTILVAVCLTLKKAVTSVGKLLLKISPDREKSLLFKKYEVTLVGHGGVAQLRINEPAASDFPSLTIRPHGEYDYRLDDADRTMKLVLKNRGARHVCSTPSQFRCRTAFACVRVLDQNGDHVPPNKVSLSFSDVLLPKLARNTEILEVKIISQKLWEQICDKREMIRIAIYFGAERQRARLLAYSRIRNCAIEPVEGIEFTKLQLPTVLEFDPSVLGRDDIRAFNEELTVTFIRLIPQRRNFSLNPVDEGGKLFPLEAVDSENDFPIFFEFDMNTCAL